MKASDIVTFKCSYEFQDGKEEWTGLVDRIYSFGNHFEISVRSRSSITVVIGKTSRGLIACMPDFNAGCYLSTLDDAFYNSEKLIYAMNNAVDGTTVANALKAIKDKIKFR